MKLRSRTEYLDTDSRARNRSCVILPEPSHISDFRPCSSGTSFLFLPCSSSFHFFQLIILGSLVSSAPTTPQLVLLTPPFRAS
jgi:hypothetical protein